MRRRRAGGIIDRRDFLKLAGGAVATASAGLLFACAGEASDTEGSGGTLEEEQEIGSAADRGRLLARPGATPADAEAPTGLQPLGLGSGRDGLVYVPEGYGEREEAPLALALHGAGGDARAGISPLLDFADEFGLVLLAPASRERTWDVLLGGYGPDVEFIDRALEQTFDRLAVNPARLAVSGFSDGASYALSLGLPNGDLFTHVIAFSPGFMAPATQRGSPRIFISHGTRDRVLPIDRTSRRVVPRLERDGYEVVYREFDGPHAVPKPVTREALEWFIAS
ncbi:MAG: alpha/beta hydrolase-fold protein [Actinomycetota bacterium]|nr:alpha/beta hydrolase-fold protein [Actinomycetota bacterium]